MFGKKTAADKLAAALDEYRADYERKLRQQPNNDAANARQRIAQATELLRRTKLGDSLVTLLEDVKYWPSWSQRPDFLEHLGFPASEISATTEYKQEEFDRASTTAIRFVYSKQRYELIFIDGGRKTGFGGDGYHHGTLNFVAGDQVVLGLDISRDGDDFPTWSWYGVHALRMGDWAKHLIEIAAHIKASQQASSKKFDDDRALEKGKNIVI